MKHRFVLMGSCLALLATSRVVHAQSVWNAGTSSWFTPGNWTPSGVPDTNIKAQINNGGTAQITAAGAAANTVILGNAAGESGTLSISGAGQLTVDSTTGFYLIVGENGTGTLNVSAGGAVVNAPVLYIGDLTGSVGTVTVTGVGSSITSQFQLEVGRSGTGTLNLLDGATFTSQGAFDVGNGTGAGHLTVDGTTANLTTLNLTSVNIGGTTLGGTGDITVTGAKAKLNASAGLDVGSAGTGTLTLSAGAKGNATALLIGDDGTGTVTLTGANTAMTLTGVTAKVTVGNTSTANLNIQAGATLSSVAGVVGQTPGSVGTVTITGADSSWNIGGNNGFTTGRPGLAGGTAAINILNGGKLTATNLSAYTDTAIKVDGPGSQLSLPNDSGASINKALFLGSVGTNKLDVTNGGALVSGSSILTTNAGTSLTINLTGTGSSWTATPLVGTLTTQFGGAGTASFTLDDHATFTYTQNGIFNVDATGAGTASLTVKNGAIFDVGTTSTLLRIGQDGTGSLTIESGGTVNTAHAYIGEDVGAVGTATVSGVGTTFNAHDLQVGTIGGQGTVTISSGAFLFGDAVIGGTGGSGTMTVTDAGTHWTIASGPVNAFVFVENNGSLKILAGASVGGGSLSAGTGGTNGTILIDGNGTQTTGTTLFTDGTGTITIQNKAVVAGATAILGQNEGANTFVTVDGVGTQWNMTGNPEVGAHGGATLNIQNGAHVSSNQFYLGYDKNADNTGANGIVNVTGAGSSLAAAAYLRVADYFFTSGTLTISLGGTVTSVSGAGAGNASGIASTNNATGSIVVTDADSSWANTGDVYVGKNGTTGVGTLTVANSGTVAVTGAVSINPTSTLNIGTGGTSGTFSAASVANSGLIHFNYTDSVTYSAPTSGTGALTKDGSGALVFTGTHTYTGATTINGGLFQVDGTLGNTAVTIASGARLGGTGTIGGGVTIQNGGILAPGDSPGTLTVGDLTLNSSSIENYELGTPNTPGGATNDLTIVNGNLTLDGTLNVAGGAGFSAGVYRLFDYTGTLTNNTLDLGALPAGFTYTIDLSTANQVNLDVNAIGATFNYWNGTHTTPNGTVNGGTGTWNNTATNWTNSAGSASGAWANAEAAHFGGTAGTVTLGENVTAAAIEFLAGTGTYTIDAAGGKVLTISGTGVTNNSGVAQHLVADVAGSTGGQIVFNGSAAAGDNQTTYMATGNSTANGTGGQIIFNGSSRAGSATLDNNGGATGPNTEGATYFHNSASADHSTLNNNGGVTGGLTLFDGTSKAASATITNNGGTSAGNVGGQTQFTDSASADSATINNFGGIGGGGNGLTTFLGSSTAASATINNDGGTTNFNGSSTADTAAINNINGGTTVFRSTAANATVTSSATSGTYFYTFNQPTGSARFIFNDGTSFLDISGAFPSVNVGSLEGNGQVLLGSKQLITGANNRTTTFSGVIQDGGQYAGNGGALTKNGTGTLFLTGANTYTGATTINSGAVFVNGSLGNTATTVNSGGVLGGAGTIGGSVTLNNNSAFLPGADIGSVGTIHTGDSTVNSGATLIYELSTAGVIGGAANDLAEVTGNLTLGGGVLNINGLAGFGIGTYRIFDYTGTLLGSALTIGSAPLGYLYTVDTSTAGEVNLIVAGGGPLPIAYWNGPNLAPNGKVNGGPGSWDNHATNWTDATGTVLGTWGGGLGIFGGTAGTVTLGSNINFTDLIFTTDGYFIRGNGFALNGTGPVSIQTAGGVNATIDATIFAPNGISKLGAGSLFFDGTLFGNLAVLQGLLGGHGSIIGNLVNAATVSPGHSPGTLHVSGNYTQTPNALLKIEIGGSGSSEHDLLTVGGTAALDGTLQLVRLNHFKLKRHKPITFLTAAAGVNGEFANIVTDFTSDTILKPTVVYHAKSVALEAVQGLFADLAGLTPNQKAVAHALDSAAHDKRADAIFEYLDYRQLNKLPGDLDKIAPEELTSVFTIGTSLANVQSSNIQRRTDDIRSGANGFNAANLALNGDGPQYSGDFRTGVAGPNGSEIRDDGKDANETREVAPSESNRWGVFLSGTGEWVSVGDTFNARGYDLTSGGFTLGVDYKVTPNFAVGLAASYTGTTADLADRGRVYVNGGKLGLYATYFRNEQVSTAPTMSKDAKEVPAPSSAVAKGFYADFAVFGGYNSYAFHRSALRGQARGDTDGGELNVLAGVGYDFKKGNLTFGPTASFNYTYIGTNDFTEHGSLAPLNVHGGKGESLRTAFGFKASYDWRIGSVLIKPEIRAAWQHEFGDAAYALDADFANGAGNSFRVDGPQFGRDSALLGAGFAIQFNERFSTYFYYDGELGRKNYQSSSITGGVRFAF